MISKYDNIWYIHVIAEISMGKDKWYKQFLKYWTQIDN